MELLEKIRQISLDTPDKVAVVDHAGHREITYRELEALSGKIAGKLKILGCAKGVPVLVKMGRRAEYLATEMGAMKLGCPVIPVLPEYPGDRIAYIVKDSGASVVADESVLKDLDSCEIPETAELLQDDPIFMCYTSGSTGNPKGVVYHVGAFVSGLENAAHGHEGVEPLIFGAAAPFSFIASMFETYCLLIRGGCVHILPDEVRKDVKNTENYYAEHHLTAGFISPRMLRVYHNKDRDLQRIFTGSERVSDLTGDGYELYNFYGQTEAMLLTCFKVDHSYENTPVGKPMRGHKIVLLDENGQEVPQGEEGEVCVQGDLPREYKNLPEQSARTFIPLENGEILLHTGDIGRILPDGNLVYVNRKDWMVKINGQRVEPGEIEAVIKKLDGIENAAVKDFTTTSGITYLCGYYLSPEPLDEQALRQSLGQTLPEYMIPAYFVHMERLPVNVNGKLDRSALPAPDLRQKKAEYVAPAGKVETLLCQGFSQVLGCGRVGTADDFFSLGGDSIKVMELQNYCNLPGLSTSLIFAQRTPGEIAASLSQDGEDLYAQAMAEHRESYPLTASQMGVYLACMQTPDTLMYNIPAKITIPADADVDPQRFVQACNQAFCNHASLRCRIREEDGQPRLIVSDQAPEIVVKECPDLKQAEKNFIRPFDLTGPLCRAELLKTEGGMVVMMDFHHIIFDGTSSSVILREIGQAYDGIKPEPEQMTQPAMGIYEEKIPETAEYVKSKNYYRSILDGVEPADLIFDKPGDPSAADKPCGYLVKNTEGILNPGDADAYAAQTGVTVNSLLLGAFAYTFSKFSGSADTLLTTVNHGRHDSRMANTTGMFVRTLPMHLIIDENMPVGEFLTNVQIQLQKNIAHDSYPFVRLAEEYGLNSDYMFVYQNDRFNALPLAGRELPVKDLEVESAQSKLSMMIFREKTGFRIRAAYRTDLFEKTYMESFVDTYLQVLREFLSRQCLKDVCLTGEKAQDLLDSFNNTAKEYDRTKTVVDLIREQARNHPDNPAVVFADKTYTYQQLDDLSDRIAGYLRRQGIGREDVVSIFLPRCEYMPITALGVLKAGGAYQPLDPSYPRERLQFMMDDAGAKMLIADESLLPLVDNYHGPVLLTRDIPDLPICEPSEERPKPEDLLILLYTSGTTGTPKGVMLEHGNLMAFCHWYCKYFGLTAESRVSAYASFGFDANMMDTYPTLISGATLYIIDEKIRLDLVAMNRYLEENKITHSFFTTQIGRALATSLENHSLTQMSLGGEVLTPCEPPEGYCLNNMYGPTECMICITSYPVDRLCYRVPIGYALDNVKLYIVDSLGRRMPVGAPGELCAAGYQVGRGYLNRPDQKAFCVNPYSDEEGYTRMYRTGDIVRYLPDGAVDFIGRRDSQVKIRGFRIELSEVENVIRQFDGIRDAAVVANDAAAGGKYLAAYVVADKKIEKEALDAFILDKKPPYMVPAAMMQIDKIPLNVNGKLDKRKLPEIVITAEETEEDTRPMSLLEEKIHAIAAEILGSDRFGVATSLQKCGLSSLSVIKLAVELKKQFGFEADVRKMMKNCTVLSIENDLQQWLLEQLRNPQEAAVSDSCHRKENYPLSASQFGVYADCMRQPESVKYNIPFVLTFPVEMEVSRLQTAVQKVLGAHPYIFTHLNMQEEDIAQSYTDHGEAEIPVQTMTEQAYAAYKAHVTQPINIMKAPLFRVQIVKTEKAVYLMADFHHIIFDGASVDLFGHQLLEALAGTEISRESYTYFDYIEDEHASVKGEQYRKAEGFFREMLAECESASEITPDLQGSEEDGGFGLTYTETDLASAEKFCRDQGITPAVLYLAATFYTVSRFTNSRNVYLSTISSGRSDLKLTDCFGMFVRTLPVGIRIAECTVLDFIRKTKDVFSGAIENEIYPYSTICRNYGYGPSIVYEYQIGVTEQLILDGQPIGVDTMNPDRAKFKTAVHVEDHDGKPSVVVIYNTALYSENLMHTLAEAVNQTVKAMIDAPESPVRKISMLSPEELKLLEQFSVSSCDAVAYTLMHQAFVAQAAANPHRTALIAGDRTLTYEQLDKLSNRAANALIKNGLGKGQRVIILLNRHSGILVSILGVLKAGGTYIPACPEYPKERITSILEDCGAAFIITEPELTEKYPNTLTVEKLLSCTDEQMPQVVIAPEDLAYMIYTSGSTGKPKGVRIRHCGIANYLTDHPANTHIHAIAENGHCYGSVTTVSFDMWLKESFAALSNGLTLAFADDVQSKDPFALADFMQENHVDVFNATPSRLQQYLEIESFAEAIKDCRVVLSGGEKYPESLLKTLQKLTDAKIINTYGPTEITVSSNAKELTKETEISIGRPLLNYTEYIVDSDDNLVPVGVVGELIICGIGVADGYHNLPEKTKEAFVTFWDQRAYRSGDYACWTSRGDVVILGRKDNQVKLRGLRIELGEVEKCLSQCDGIMQSLVMIRKLGREDALCAYYTAKTELDVETLKAELGKKLTDYMIPSAFVQLDKMPMTFNGKIDRKALPEPQKETHKSGKVPKTATEQTFCTIFGKILDLDKVYADDNFFSLGGSSLTVTQVIIHANKAGIKNIAYGDVFSHPTPETLAAFVGGEQESEFGSMENYDYMAINDLLKKNNLDSFRNGQRQKLGDTLLTGATGFLGIHILYEMLHNYTGKIYCPIRAASDQAAEARMNAQFYYYFEESLREKYADRVIIKNGDITRPETLEPLFENKIDTVLNCAANVKHFSKGTDIEDIDYYAVLSLIDLCKKYGSRLVQTSTKSIAGTVPASDNEPLYRESQLFIGQSQQSKYTQAKFAAERAVLEEAAAGFNAKIMRYGNLSARDRDGEFQINFKTNSFMGRVRSNTIIGGYPYAMNDQTFEMSPIDYVAKATLLLAQTPKECTVFHVYNNHRLLMVDLCDEMNKMGLSTREVEIEEYQKLLDQAKQDPQKAQALTGLLAYENMTHGQALVPVDADNRYTMQVLYHMGFRWPVTSWDYMRRFLQALKSLEFFQ